MSTPYEEAYLLARTRRLPEAAERFEHLYRAQPTHVFAGACLGHVWFELGRREEAIAVYREVKVRVEAQSARFSDVPETERRMLMLAWKRLRETDADVLRTLIAEHFPDVDPGAAAAARLQESARCLAVGERPGGATIRCQPELLHLSGVAEQPYHDPADFPELTTFSKAHAELRTEVLGRWLEPGLAVPYVQYREGTVAADDWRSLNHSTRWSVINLYKNGERMPEAAQRFPRLMAALEQLPLQRIPGFAPNAMLSVLHPGTEIKPHFGSMNGRLIAHYPFVVPPRCGRLTVAGESREWVEGEWIVFDDSLVHSAVNESEAPRLVLIVDMWNPTLNHRERACVSAFLQYLQRVSGAPAPDALLP